MADSDKIIANEYATADMKTKAQERAQFIASGADNKGPVGCFDELQSVYAQDGGEGTVVGYLPKEIPCEAWSLWNYDGYLVGAWSSDRMNAWYFNVYAEELPYYDESCVYEAKSKTGEPFSVAQGESAIMAQYIKGDIDFFFINGERFSENTIRSKEADDDSYFVMCSGSDGRGCIVQLEKEGYGASIFIFSGGSRVKSLEERMGLPAIVTSPSKPVEGFTIMGRLTSHIGAESNPFWYVKS